MHCCGSHCHQLRVCLTLQFLWRQTICDYLEIKTAEYDLDPQNSWQVDVPHLESLITPRTRAILVNNPSNPCGSVFSKEHLREILDVARRRLKY